MEMHKSVRAIITSGSAVVNSSAEWVLLTLGHASCICSSLESVVRKP